MLPSNMSIAFFITLFAGLATGVGGLIALVAKKTNTKFLSASLGFSAGVMIFVSFVEIYPKSVESISAVFQGQTPQLIATIGFFGGMLFIAMIDKLVPDFENPHTMHSEKEIEAVQHNEELPRSTGDLYRMGMMSAIAIAIHNFPEGLATFTATIQDPSLGIPIGVAIAIHNIPEGIAVAIPLYYSTGNRKKAFFYSLASGLAEPFGAFVGFLLLSQFFNDLTFGILFAMVAGIMVFISLDELLPASEEYGEHHVSLYGLISGMLVMAISLIVL